jgi:hypothetical protein
VASLDVVASAVAGSGAAAGFLAISRATASAPSNDSDAFGGAFHFLGEAQPEARTARRMKDASRLMAFGIH